MSHVQSRELEYVDTLIAGLRFFRDTDGLVKWKPGPDTPPLTGHQIAAAACRYASYLISRLNTAEYKAMVYNETCEAHCTVIEELENRIAELEGRLSQ